MEIKSTFKVRSATQQDCGHLDSLITRGHYIHRHLDWRTPLDWIGHPPYFVLEDDDSIKAVLACPPDPTTIGWVRVFGTDGSIQLNYAWDHLWAQVKNSFSSGLITKIAILSVKSWLKNTLELNEFKIHQFIKMLTWEEQDSDPVYRSNHFPIRLMTRDDIPQIENLDGLAFEPIWHNSLTSLQKAFQQAAYATVVEDRGKIIAYQISTNSMFGGHLARLAVHPQEQGKGIGKALVQNVITQLKPMGVHRISVNTQSDNLASLALYQSLDFQETGELFPVYIYEVCS